MMAAAVGRSEAAAAPASFPGVSRRQWTRSDGTVLERWQGHFWHAGQTTNVGSFSTAEEASRAVNAAHLQADPSSYDAWASGVYVEEPSRSRLRAAAASAPALPQGADTRRIRCLRGLYYVNLPGGCGHATIEEALTARDALELELAAQRETARAAARASAAAAAEAARAAIAGAADRRRLRAVAGKFQLVRCRDSRLYPTIFDALAARDQFELTEVAERMQAAAAGGGAQAEAAAPAVPSAAADAPSAHAAAATAARRDAQKQLDDGQPAKRRRGTVAA